MKKETLPPQQWNCATGIPGPSNAKILGASPASPPEISMGIVSCFRQIYFQGDGYAWRQIT